MESTGESSEEFRDVYVLDRCCERSKHLLGFSLRRWLDIGFEKGLGKWATSPERGRFIVLTTDAILYEFWCFTDDENEMIESVRQILERGPVLLGRVPTIGFGGLVAPEVESRLLQALSDTTA